MVAIILFAAVTVNIVVNVAAAYVAGFFVMPAIIGFHPGSTPRGSAPTAAPLRCSPRTETESA